MSTTKKHTIIPNATKIPTNSRQWVTGQWVTAEEIEEMQNVMTPPKRKFVVAGTFGEYKDYIERKGYDRREYIYVSDISTIRGLYSISGVYIGTWKNRPDISQIQSQIKIIKERELAANAMSNHIDRRLLDETTRKINGGLIAQTMADIPESTMRIIQAKNTLNNAIDLMQDTMWLEKNKENT